MLTVLTVKWYFELPRASFDNFTALATRFLTHFQLPIIYEIGMKLLTKFKQTTTTHIFYHIHEWHHHRRMVKTFVRDQLLTEWFIKSLLPSITEDVAKGGVVTKQKVIAHAQYFGLIYTHPRCSMIIFHMHLDKILLFHHLHLVMSLMLVTV